MGDVGARHGSLDRGVIYLARRRERSPVRQPPEGDDLGHLHRPANPGGLEQDRETAGAFVPRDARQGPAVEADVAGCGRYEARQRAQERGLAGAVRADEADELTAPTANETPSRICRS